MATKTNATKRHHTRVAGTNAPSTAKKCKVKKFKSEAQAKGFVTGYNAGKSTNPAKRKGKIVTIC